ncbi:hypothetical protein OG792_20590 [Micromonospora sp. NBC_01699]|nr:hypothetical protein [Micromonospora sp. NBC_01699]
MTGREQAAEAQRANQALRQTQLAAEITEEAVKGLSRASGEGRR